MLDIKTEFMNQVADDWKQVPYTNLTITSGSSCPSTHPQAVYDRVWYGMKHGCNCLNVYSRYIDTSNMMVVSKECDYNQTRDGCLQVGAKWPVH